MPRVFASPLARRLASQEGIDLGRLKGTGPHGRIVKRDIEAAPRLLPVEVSHEEAQAFTVEPHTPMRRTIARRLTAAKQEVPHFYLQTEVTIDRLMDMRKALNGQAQGYKISVNDIVIKTAAMALERVPEANVAWDEEGLRLYKEVDISVAVALPKGLVTPVVRQASRKGLRAISEDMRQLIDKARAGKLMPEEYQGGTCSLSNVGMLGIDCVIPILNPPQACILGIGAGREVVRLKGERPYGAHVMTATLSADHRAVDGAVGARFLSVFKKLIEDPLFLLV